MPKKKEPETFDNLFDAAGMNNYFLPLDEEEFVVEGKRLGIINGYFDASLLEDSPPYQANASGTEVFVIHLAFPTRNELEKAITAFTEGERRTVPSHVRELTINGYAKRKKDGKLWIEHWIEKLSSVPKKGGKK